MYTTPIFKLTATILARLRKIPLKGQLAAHDRKALRDAEIGAKNILDLCSKILGK